MHTATPLRELDPLLKEVIRHSSLDIGVISAETLLLVAILDRAFRDTKDPRPHIRNSAILWLQNEHPHSFSASQICEHLGIDHRILKKTLETSLKTSLSRIAA